MKILKKGFVPKPPRAKVYRGECPLCHCQVEVLEDDPKLLHQVDIGSYVLCPTKGCPQVRIVVKEYITRQFEDKSEVC
jgi:hypothetical protein